MTAVPADDPAGTHLNAGPTPVGRRSVLRGLGTLAGAGAAAVLMGGCSSDALAGVPATPMEAATSSLDPYFPGYGAGGFLVNHYALQVVFAEDLESFEGTASIEIMPYAALTGLSLDLRGPVVHSAEIDGRGVAFSQTAGGKVRLASPGVLAAGRNVMLKIGYSARSAPVSVVGVGRAGWLPVEGSGQGGSSAGAGAGAASSPSATPTTTGEPSVTPPSPLSSLTSPNSPVCILSLPVGASTWYPCVDHPSAKAAYDISVSAPARFSVVANGRLIGKTTAGGQVTWAYHHPGPMASYLATIQVGEFQLDDAAAVQDQAPADVLIRNAYPAAYETAAEYDLGRQGEMLSVFSKLFGAYPFDVYGAAVVVGLPTQGGPGGENPDRRSFAAQTLGLIDASLIDGRRTNENQVANAVARQWFGAGVSVADWSQGWLTEGFAKYAEWLWAERSGGNSSAVSAAAAMTQLRALPQDLVLADPGAHRILDVRLGLRGACYLQSLRQTVGDLQFFQILQVWCNRAQAGTSTTADFVQIIPEVYTASDLTQFSRAWVYSAGLPRLS